LTGIAAGLLLILGFGFDSADGQLARLRDQSSLRGEWLDHLVDSAKMVLVHTSVLIAALRFYGTPIWWIGVPLTFLLVAVVQFSGVLITQFLLARRDAGGGTRQPSTLRSVALLPADYGVLATSFLLSGVPAGFVPVYSALAALNAVITVALIINWWRRLG
jgi:phosphatidylglycerophosphate synthase